jgi:hypothetical protein
MQRQDERKPVSRSAKIKLGDGKTMPCRISDISRGGAKLTVEHTEWLPHVFELHDTFAGTDCLVKIMWRSETSVGVRFVERAPTVAQRKQVGFGRRK